jgi:hypothetical protein
MWQGSSTASSTEEDKQPPAGSEHITEVNYADTNRFIAATALGVLLCWRAGSTTRSMLNTSVTALWWRHRAVYTTMVSFSSDSRISRSRKDSRSLWRPPPQWCASQAPYLSAPLAAGYAAALLLPGTLLPLALLATLTFPPPPPPQGAQNLADDVLRADQVAYEALQVRLDLFRMLRGGAGV